MKKCVALLLGLAFIVLISGISRAQTGGNADFDSNGEIEFADFILFAGAWGGSDAKFDLNGNGTVDFPDFLDFVTKYQIANPGPPPAPEIDLSATSLDFGNVDTGQSSNLVLTVSNTGNALLTVSEIASSDGQFTVSGSAFTIGGGASEVVTVTFTPGAAGGHSGTLTIGSDDSNEGSLEVSLSGTGTTPAPVLKQVLIVDTPGSTRHIMLLVSEGEFPMGTDKLVNVPDLEENVPGAVGEPLASSVHTVFLSNYYIDQFEVTNEQFLVFLNNVGRNFDPTVGEFTPLIDLSGMEVQIRFSTRYEITSVTLFNRPAVYATWVGANAYCQWMGGRLPTEVEWEKAAVGTDGRPYPWGSGTPVSSRANIRGFMESAADVGSFPRGVSPYGVHDMAGNVQEWVFDWFSAEYYKVTPRENPQGPGSGTQRTVKSSDWLAFYNEIHPFDSENGIIGARRNGRDPINAGVNLGFRCVQDPSP
ncbi:MAG: SUMF1/EgtB/PvdO family nonheme iron enzyme [bacterium]|nr:SUMF1/EgtB/PvdO family nonheme iron enzyme [bacterium]